MPSKVENTLDESPGHVKSSHRVAANIRRQSVFGGPVSEWNRVVKNIAGRHLLRSLQAKVSSRLPADHQKQSRSVDMIRAPLAGRQQVLVQALTLPSPTLRGGSVL